MPNRSNSSPHRPGDNHGRIGHDVKRHGGASNSRFRFDAKGRRSRSRSRSSRRQQRISPLRYKRRNQHDINNHHSDRKYRNKSRSRSRGAERSRNRVNTDPALRIKSEISPKKEDKKRETVQENRKSAELHCSTPTTIAEPGQTSKKQKLEDLEKIEHSNNQQISSHSTTENQNSQQTIHATENPRNAFVEIFEVDSKYATRRETHATSPTKTGCSEVVITDLLEDVSEPEIRMTISQNKAPRPDKIIILNCRSKSKFCKAILTYRSYHDAIDLRSKFKGKFMSKTVNIQLENCGKKSEKVKSEESPKNISNTDAVKQESIREEKNPSTSSKKLISVKSDSFLKDSSNINDNDISGGSPSTGGLSPPSGGVSPPRVEDVPNITVGKLLSTLFAPKVEPILVDIQCDDGVDISKIKVFLVNHKKCQQFFGKEPQILVGAVLRYVKKYYPTKENMKLILVTACISSFEKFMKALAQNIINADMFSTLFDFWTDLYSITTSYLKSESKLGMPKSVQFDPKRIEKLLQGLVEKEVKKFDTVMMMKTILDANPFFSTDGLKSFDPNKLLGYCRPCRLPDENYLLVLLHVGIIELEIGLEGKMSPSIGTLGFRNSLKGSWFVPIKPEIKEGKVIHDSAKQLGFSLVGNAWVWGQEDTTSCLGEKEALTCFLSTLQEELSASKSSGVILLTPRNDLTLAVLLSALNRHSLIDMFSNIVTRVGAVEELAEAKDIRIDSNDLSGFEEYYFKTFNKKTDLSQPQNVPKILYQILESLLKSAPCYENYYSQYVHTVISPYTNNIMFASKIPELIEGFYHINILENVAINPNSELCFFAELLGVPKCELGQRFFIKSLCGAIFMNMKVELENNFKFEITAKNQNSELVNLVQGQMVGVAHGKNEFLFPVRSKPSYEKSLSESKYEKQSGPSEAVSAKKDSSSIALPKKKRNLPGMWPSSSNFSSSDSIVNAHQSVKSIRKGNEMEDNKEPQRCTSVSTTRSAELKCNDIAPVASSHVNSHPLGDQTKQKEDCPIMKETLGLNIGSKSTIKKVSHPQSEIIELEEDQIKTRDDKSKRQRDNLETEKQTTEKKEEMIRSMEIWPLSSKSDSSKESQNTNKSKPRFVEIEVLSCKQKDSNAKVAEIIELDSGFQGNTDKNRRDERDIVEIVDDDEITEISSVGKERNSSIVEEVTTLSDSEDSEDISFIEVVPKKKSSVKYMKNGCAYVDPTIIQRKIRDYMEKKKNLSEKYSLEKNRKENTSKESQNGIMKVNNDIGSSKAVVIETDSDIRLTEHEILYAEHSEITDIENEILNQSKEKYAAPSLILEEEIQKQSEKELSVGDLINSNEKEISRDSEDTHSIEIQCFSPLKPAEETVCSRNNELSKNPTVEKVKCTDTSLEEKPKAEGDSILLVNPISVSSTAPIVYAPLNQLNICGEKRWICDYCVKTYKNRRDLVEHINDHFQLYICPVCDKICNSKRNLKDHSVKFHKNSQTDDLNLILDPFIQFEHPEMSNIAGESGIDSTEQKIEDFKPNLSIDNDQEMLDISEEFEIDIKDTRIEKEIHESDHSDCNSDLQCDIDGTDESKDLNETAKAEFRSEKTASKKTEEWKVTKKFVASSTSGRRTQSELKERFMVSKNNTVNQRNRKNEDISRKIGKTGMHITIVNDVIVDDIVDMGKNEPKTRPKNPIPCQNCRKNFSTNKALANHIVKFHNGDDSHNICDPGRSKPPLSKGIGTNQISDSISVLVASKVIIEAEFKKTEEVSRKPDIDNSKPLGNKKNKKITTSFIKMDEPIVLRMEKVLKGLKPITISSDVDLSEDFSSLLMAPQFSDLIKTFILFHQLPPDSLDYSQKLFGDLLVSELVTADINDDKGLEDILVKIHKTDGFADITDWKRYIGNEIESISLASEADRNFDLDSAIQIMILHCLPALQRAS